MTQVRFSTRKYLTSHGREPKGRGGWMFIVMDGSNGGEVEIFPTPANLTLTEAKKFAREHVHRHWMEELKTGHLYLEVAP